MGDYAGGGDAESLVVGGQAGAVKTAHEFNSRDWHSDCPCSVMTWQVLEQPARPVIREVSMQHCTTTLGSVERDQLTLSLLEYVTPYLRKCAQSGELDFEDLYQDASIKIMQILDRYRDQVRYLRAYVSVSVHNLVVDKARYVKKRRAVSLDDVLLDGVSCSLADLLPDSYRVAPETVLLAQERLVELCVKVEAVRHFGKRRMLRELYATAQAGVRIDDRRVLAGKDR